MVQPCAQHIRAQDHPPKRPLLPPAAAEPAVGLVWVFDEGRDGRSGQERALDAQIGHYLMIAKGSSRAVEYVWVAHTRRGRARIGYW